MKNESRKSTHKLVHIVTQPGIKHNQALDVVLQDIFCDGHHKCQVHEWHQWGDGRVAITSALTSGADLIVAYGDYDLISDVANGIYLHDVPLAIIRESATLVENDMKSTLKPVELEKTLLSFVEERGEMLWIDMGDVQDQRFLFHMYMHGGNPEQHSVYQLVIDDIAYSETGAACLISRRENTDIEVGERKRQLFDIHVLNKADFGQPSKAIQRLSASDIVQQFSGSEIRIDASQEQNVYLDGNRLTTSSMFIKPIKKAIQVYMPDHKH